VLLFVVKHNAMRVLRSSYVCGDVRLFAGVLGLVDVLVLCV
jgi:hypothetical protein